MATVAPGVCRSQHPHLSTATRRADADAAGKKKAAAIQQEVVEEVGRLLRVVVAAKRTAGALDLETVEQATRDALHQAGASVLETLLNEDEASERRTRARSSSAACSRNRAATSKAAPCATKT